jgi:hypothetical protein
MADEVGEVVVVQDGEVRCVYCPIDPGANGKGHGLALND